MSAPDERRTVADVEIAELRVEVKHLANAVDEFKIDIKELTMALNQARGGWKIIGALAGLAGAITGGVMSTVITRALH